MPAYCLGKNLFLLFLYFIRVLVITCFYFFKTPQKKEESRLSNSLSSTGILRAAADGGVSKGSDWLGHSGPDINDGNDVQPAV